jgi:hypothetical protein
MTEHENNGATPPGSPKRRPGAMLYKTTRFKSMAAALVELEQFMKSPALLENGKPLKQFGGALPRELVGNWMICAAANAEEDAGERMVFHSDPLKGDGIIEDTKTGETFPTEHVLVPMPRGLTELDIEAAIAQAITKKQNKGGAPYASGKTLVVFLNASGGEWKPTRIAKNLPTHDFAAVWVVSLFNAKDGEYIYGVANLQLDIGPAPTWTVRIAKDFRSWSVDRKQ